MDTNEVKSLNRAALLQKEELEKVKVDLGKDTFVYVRQMTGREKNNWEVSLVKEGKDAKGNATYEKSLEDFRAKLAVCTVCDEDGKLVFLPDDYTLLSKNMSAARLEKIADAASILNAITEKDKEDLVKNSKADPEEDSNSVSAQS